jgi:Rrf2 family protein
MGKMPERFLLQILRDLVSHGILASARGVEGGYMLERPADRISLLDVIEAVDGPMASTLPSSDGLSAQSKSKLVEALSGATDSTRRELAGVTLADVVPQTTKVR